MDFNTWIHLAVFIASGLGLIVAGTWRLGKEMEKSLEPLRDQMAILQKKMYEMELDVHKTFVRHDSFYEIMNRFQDAMNARIDKIEAKIDRLMEAKRG